MRRICRATLHPHPFTYLQSPCVHVVGCHLSTRYRSESSSSRSEYLGYKMAVNGWKTSRYRYGRLRFPYAVLDALTGKLRYLPREEHITCREHRIGNMKRGTCIIVEGRGQHMHQRGNTRKVEVLKESTRSWDPPKWVQTPTFHWRSRIDMS